MPETTSTHPDAPEQRTVDVNVEALDTRGRTLHGYAAVYGAESGDLGGFRERIAPGAFAAVLDADVRCLLNHDPNEVLGRTRSGTLRLSDEQRGLRFECDLPDSPLGQNVREAVRRGDVDGASFRFKVGTESWDRETRTVQTIAELHDVTVATYGAYPAASVELRTRPERAETENTNAGQDRQEGDGAMPPTQTQDGAAESRAEDTQTTTEATEQRQAPAGGLAVEDRAAEAPSTEERIGEAIRSINKGESRSLTTADASAGPITPPELSTYLFDKLRPASIALASGMVVIPTDRQKVTWPQIVSDVDPTWVAELEPIPTGDPGFDSLDAEPKKLAHLISPISNEVIDDSEPAAVDVLNTHLVTMLALKLDRGIFEGSNTDPKSITGLKYQAGQSISLGTNGAALTNFDPFIEAVGKLRDANVPGPYAIACHGSVLTGLELLKDSDGNQLTRPDGLPPFFASSQLSTTESKGTATDARSAYVYAPNQVVLVRRKDAEVQLDRSRLFDSDASEMRGVARADLLVPNPVAVVRVEGIVPA